MKNIWNKLLVLAAVIFLFSGCVGKKEAAKENVPEELAQEGLAPVFTVYDLSGERINFSDIRARQPAILLFWTTWCPFCRVELKALSVKYEGLKSGGIAVLPLNVNEPAGKVSNFLEKMGINIRVFLDKGGDVAAAYDSYGVPTYILIDRSGKVVLKAHRFPEEYKEMFK